MLETAQQLRGWKIALPANTCLGAKKSLEFTTFRCHDQASFVWQGWDESAMKICVTNYCCKRRCRMHNEAGNKMFNVPISAPSKPDIPNHQVISLTICTPLWKTFWGSPKRSRCVRSAAVNHKGVQLGPEWRRNVVSLSSPCDNVSWDRGNDAVSPRRRSFVFAFAFAKVPKQ